MCLGVQIGLTTLGWGLGLLKEHTLGKGLGVLNIVLNGILKHVLKENCNPKSKCLKHTSATFRRVLSNAKHGPKQHPKSTTF